MRAYEMENRVRANANIRKAKRTEWYREGTPKHKGWYEVEQFPGSLKLTLRHWDGQHWMTGDNEEKGPAWMYVSLQQDWVWRGLVSDLRIVKA